jgi:hypothetical protein
VGETATVAAVVAEAPSGRCDQTLMGVEGRDTPASIAA